jgi:hypothetical protein
MGRYIVVDHHEKIYAHLSAAKSYMSLALSIFEHADQREMDDIRKNIVHHVRCIEGLLTGP